MNPPEPLRSACRVAIAAGLMMTATCAFAPGANARALGLAERIAARRAIEQVYWNHRIWPRDNPGAKPPLSAVISDDRIRTLVEDDLRKSNALGTFFGHPITSDEIQAELDRMARDTNDSAMLEELFAALGNDPDLIAEALVRPRLASARLRSAYASDARVHGELERTARAALATCDKPECLRALGGESSEQLWKLGAGAAGRRPDPWNGTIELGHDGWTALLAGLTARLGGAPQTLASRGVSALHETREGFEATSVLSESATEIRTVTVVWRKRPFEDWWSAERAHVSSAPASPEGSYRMPALVSRRLTAQELDDTWAPTSTGANVPDPRGQPSAIWTGAEMIVWGGFRAGYGGLNTGGLYDPATDTWLPTSVGLNVPSGRVGHTAVWTGTEMIIWGGATYSGGAWTSTGGRYNPAGDSWIATSSGATAPIARVYFTAVWTGGVMIVWGGRVYSGPATNSGGRYNPNNDGWAATSTGLNVPSPRESHTGIWTGSEMIVWGGDDTNLATNTGGRYNPSSNSWTATSTTINPPTARAGHTVVWTGSEMIVWGGASINPYSPTNTGARYSPGGNYWTPTSISTGTPDAREGHTAVWTGSEMIVWGGDELISGGRYTPTPEQWVPTSTGPGVPFNRYEHCAVWAGSGMIIWGGDYFLNGMFPELNTGAIYRICPDHRVYYRDADDDGYGDASQLAACGSGGVPPPGYAAFSGDCNDSDPNVHPGAPEIVCNGVDDNCDGRVDETYPVTFAARAHLAVVGGPVSVAFGDVNGDGKLDIAVANSSVNGGSSSVSVFRGDGYGGFGSRADAPVGLQAQAVAMCDLNGDGHLDLVVANQGSNTVSVLLGNGSGGFGAHTDYATGSNPVALAIADLNADSRPDLVISNSASNTISVLLGTGGGSFGTKQDFPTGTSPHGLVVVDFNHDSRPDVAVVNDLSSTVSVMLGNGAGAFGPRTDYACGVNPLAIAVGDLNGDYRPDLIVANTGAGTLSVLPGDGAGSFGARTDYVAGTSPYSVAVGDLDNDGRPDVVTANAGSNTVSALMGLGGGALGSKFEFSTGVTPVAVAIVDVSHDGHADLVVADQGSNTVSVLIGNPAGVWGSTSTFPAGTNPTSVVAGDLSGDGKRDVAAVNLSDNTVSVYLGNGAGSLGVRTDYPVGTAPRSVAMADLNADGRPDLVVANGSANTVSVLHGTGGGAFGPKTDYATGAFPFSVAIGDLNGDGRPDLAVANHDGSSVSILYSNTLGGYTFHDDFPTGTSTFSVVIADLNGDGKNDWVSANFTSSTVTVRLAPQFAPRMDYVTGLNPYAVAVADVNGDGLPDLVTANNSANSVSVLLNSGAGTFGAKSDYNTGSGPYAVAIGDVNGDGKPDLTAANAGSNTVSVLLGDGTGAFGGKQDICIGGVAPVADALADMNGDGRLDLITTNFSSNTLSVLVNAQAYVDVGSPPAPALSSFELLPARPNPSLGRVEFQFTLAHAGRVTLEVFDVAGRRVAELTREPPFTPGSHAMSWDGRGRNGLLEPGGVYLARLRSEAQVATRKFVLLTH